MNDLMGHILKPYEDEDLTIQDLIDILDLKIETVKEKMDGQNLCIRITPDDILYARSPSDIDESLSIHHFLSKIKHKSFADSIYRLHIDLIKIKNYFTYEEIMRFVNKYISVEIIDNLNPNLLLYDNNYIIIHGAINISNLQVEYQSMDVFNKIKDKNYFIIKNNDEIDMNRFSKLISSDALRSEMDLFNIPLSKRLKDLDDFIKSSVISEFKLQESKLLKNMSFSHNISMENQSQIQNLKKNKPIYIQKDIQIKDLYKNLDFGNTSPIEGIVFFYKQKLYKLTGLYSILNKINYKMRSL